MVIVVARACVCWWVGEKVVVVVAVGVEWGRCLDAVSVVHRAVAFGGADTHRKDTRVPIVPAA